MLQLVRKPQVECLRSLTDRIRKVRFLLRKQKKRKTLPLPLPAQLRYLLRKVSPPVSQLYDHSDGLLRQAKVDVESLLASHFDQSIASAPTNPTNAPGWDHYVRKPPFDDSALLSPIEERELLEQLHQLEWHTSAGADDITDGAILACCFHTTGAGDQRVPPCHTPTFRFILALLNR